MALHDRYPRRTPYELAIPGRAFVDERFGLLKEEVEKRGADPHDPARLILMGEVGRLLQELGGAEGPAEERMRHLGAMLFHAFHFWSAGEPLYLLDLHAARYLVEAVKDTPGSAAPEAPSPAGYLQLPRNLFWARVSQEGVAEALDGFFWTLSPVEPQVMHVLGILGLRGDRPGMSAVELTSVPVSALAEALVSGAREDGDDFATDLPGGELENLYSLQTGMEVLKLLGRVFAYVEAHPGAVSEPERHPRDDADADGPDPSSLPARRIRLRDEEEAVSGASSAE